MCDRDRFFGKNPLESKMTKMVKNDLKTEFLGSLDDSIDVGQDNQKFSIKIEHYRRTFFDSYIWTFYSDLKHNSHKEKR